MVENIELFYLKESKLDPDAFGWYVEMVHHIHTYDRPWTHVGQGLCWHWRSKCGYWYPWVQLMKTPVASMMMPQEGLIVQIITAMGLDFEHSTSLQSQLHVHVGRDIWLKTEMIIHVQSPLPSYIRIVWILMYQSVDSRPGILDSTIPAGRFTFCPKCFHAPNLLMNLPSSW